MDEKKMSTDEVPQRFVEWLLSMGCPSERVPSVEKLAEMCRGQYYMVWRSLMEHVDTKKNIKHKRLQVFCNDVQSCQDNNAFCKPDSSVIEPEELSLWKRHTELRERLKEAEATVAEVRHHCEEMVEKVSSKLSHRNLACKRAENAQRSSWLLQQVAEDLRNKKANLVETKSIAECLCRIENDVDIESKLDTQLGKCMSQPHQNARLPSVSLSTTTLQCSATSNNGDVNESDEYLSLVTCSAQLLWPQLCERRAALIAALNVANTTDVPGYNKRVNPRSILTHTASLVCTLGLEACKNRVHTEKARARLASELAQLNDLSLSGESCESIVLRCEHACAVSRASTLRALLDDVTAQRGVFAVHKEDATQVNCTRQIAVIDKAIEMKRDELRRVITSLGVTERKIQKVRECLINVFNSFHSDGHPLSNRGQLPQESLVSLKSFYENKREKRKNKVDLSLDLDTSENDFSRSNIENGNPKYVDELRVYLNSFSLENNRKLVLESGEKIWMFETIQSSIDRLHTKLHDNNLSCPIVCPSVSLNTNLQRVSYLVKRKEELGMLLKQLEGRHRKIPIIDISEQIEEEQSTIDKIKKRLNENLVNLQKTTKTLELGQQNLKIWSENEIRNYISSARTIEGKPFQEYESYYIRNLDI